MLEEKVPGTLVEIIQDAWHLFLKKPVGEKSPTGQAAE